MTRHGVDAHPTTRWDPRSRFTLYRQAFLAGRRTPVFFGSALANFGVRMLLEGFAELAPAPAPQPIDRPAGERDIDAPFSALVFKVQANMDPNHRDRVAFLRVHNGRFRRGVTAEVARTEDSAEAADDQNGDDVDAVDTDVTLEIWIGRENYEPDQGFEAFTEETGIGVNVDVLPLEDATTDFIRAYQADNDPDIFQIEIDLWMALVEAGVVRDLSDLWEQWESEDPDHFNNMAEHAFGELVHEGGSYGLTAHTQPHLFGYRPDILDQVGVDPPETWDEVLDASRAIVEENPDMTGFGMAFSRRGPRAEFYTHYLAMGGPIEGGLPVLNSEAGVYQCEFYQALHAEDLITEESFAWGSGDFRGEFLAGRVAMAEAGPNVLPDWDAELSYGEGVAAAPNPGRPGAEGDFRQKIVSVPFMVSQNTEHPDEVLEFFRWYTSPEVAGPISERYIPSTNIEVLEGLRETQPWMDDDDIFATFTDPDVIGFVPSHPQALEAAEVIMDFLQGCGQDTDTDPAELADQYNEQLDQYR